MFTSTERALKPERHEPQGCPTILSKVEVGQSNGDTGMGGDQPISRLLSINFLSNFM